MGAALTVGRTTLVAAVVALGLLVGGCSDMGQARPVLIANHTGDALEVTYRVTVSGTDLAVTKTTVDAGRRWGREGVRLSLFDGQRCATGSLVATADGAVIATLDHPCRGDRWGIGSEQLPPAAR